MPTNILNVDNAILIGSNKVADWEKRFQTSFYQPAIDAVASRMWQDTPDEVKMLMRQTKPDAVKKIERRFGG